jgi:hypothetical protein
MMLAAVTALGLLVASPQPTSDAAPGVLAKLDMLADLWGKR